MPKFLSLLSFTAVASLLLGAQAYALNPQPLPPGGKKIASIVNPSHSGLSLIVRLRTLGSNGH